MITRAQSLDRDAIDVKSGEDVNALIVSEAEDTGEVAEEYEGCVGWW